MNILIIDNPAMHKVHLMLLGLALLTACAEGPRQAASTPLVETAPLTLATAGNESTYPGQIEAQASSELSFKVTGHIKQLLVKEGEQVRQGQAIATIDDRDYRLQWEATEAKYLQVKSECERIFALHEEQAVSENNYEKAVSGLQQMQAQYNHHKAQLEDCTLRAPYSGQVNRIHRQKGELALPGVPILSMISQSVPEVVITLPEKEYLQLQESSCFTASIHAFPGRIFPLKLQSISARSNASQQYQARFRLENAPKEVKIGMTLVVHILHRQAAESQQLKIASTALFEREGGSFIYLCNDSTQTITAVPVQVERILRSGEAVLTPLSDALTPGMQVVTSGVRTLIEGQQVRPLPHPSEENVGHII